MSVLGFWSRGLGFVECLKCGFSTCSLYRGGVVGVMCVYDTG